MSRQPLLGSARASIALRRSGPSKSTTAVTTIGRFGCTSNRGDITTTSPIGATITALTIGVITIIIEFVRTIGVTTTIGPPDTIVSIGDLGLG